MLTTIINFILFSLVIVLILSLFLYMIITIVDEDENYETYLLQINEKNYLLVKERGSTYNGIHK